MNCFSLIHAGRKSTIKRRKRKIKDDNRAIPHDKRSKMHKKSQNTPIHNLLFPFIILEYLISWVLVFKVVFIHIARRAHGVLTKNKKSNKNFYSRPYNNLPPKTSCGRGTIFARIVHIRAKGRETMFFSLGGMARRFAEQREANRGHVSTTLFKN